MAEAAAQLRTEARFPHAGKREGHYESFYLKAAKPGGGRGFWIRHTVHKRPRAEPTASVWFTLFDRRAEGPRAVKETVSADRLSVPEGAYIQVGDSLLEPGRATGSANAGGVSASWDLRFEGHEETFRHLPSGWMYRAPIPRTKLLSPHPDVSYDGTIEIGGERLEVNRWPGMVGHNWGAEHAERWIWMHGAGFADRPEGIWFDAGLGRIKLGPATVPWVGNGMLAIDGKHYRLGGLDRVRATEVSEKPTACRFVLTGDDIRVTGRVGASARYFVGWVYSDPDGGQHHSLNCSVANMELIVERDGRPAETLALKGGATYELGVRETDHGIPVQPFPDG